MAVSVRQVQFEIAESSADGGLKSVVVGVSLCLEELERIEAHERTKWIGVIATSNPEVWHSTRRHRSAIAQRGSGGKTRGGIDCEIVAVRVAHGLASRIGILYPLA